MRRERQGGEFVETLTAEDLQSECSRLKRLRDVLEKAVAESRSIRDLIRRAQQEHDLDALRLLLLTRNPLST